MGRFGELRELTRVRILLFLREPEAVFWVFLFPLVLAAVLGFAFRRGRIEPSRVLVADGPGAAELQARLATVEHLDAETVADPAERERRLRRAAADAIVEPGDPPRFTFDPSRPEAETARLRVLSALGLASGAPAPTLALAPVEQAGSRYVDFLFPGLLGMNLMSTGLWSIGFGVAEVRQRKVLKRMLVTPMRRSSFFLSFFLARCASLVLELLLLVLFGCLALGVPLRGSVASFAAVSLVGAFSFAGLGLLVAARPRTIQGVSGLLNLVMMPMWLGSGVFFSYERFPAVLHPVLRLLPLTPLNDALREVMLDGAGLASVAARLGVLALWGAAGFLLALRIFRWE